MSRLNGQKLSAGKGPFPNPTGKLPAAILDEAENGPVALFCIITRIGNIAFLAKTDFQKQMKTAPFVVIQYLLNVDIMLPVHHDDQVICVYLITADLARHTAQFIAGLKSQTAHHLVTVTTGKVIYSSRGHFNALNTKGLKFRPQNHFRQCAAAYIGGTNK